MTSSELLIFAYGSNMDTAQMKERCPNSRLETFIAEARGWKLCFPRRSEKRKGGVGSIERHQGSSVWGVVFSVNDKDLKTLDRREGVLIGAYTRGPLEVHSQAGKSALVQTYFAVPEGNGIFTPHRNYIEHYIKGAKQFGLPHEYIVILEQIIQQAKAD